MKGGVWNVKQKPITTEVVQNVCARFFLLADVAASSSFGGRLFGVPRRPLPQTSKRLLLQPLATLLLTPHNATNNNKSEREKKPIANRVGK